MYACSTGNEPIRPIFNGALFVSDDATRVVLETDENNSRDYINASFINVNYILLFVCKP